LTNIQENTRKGLFWTASSAAVQILISFVQLLLISKFLGPTLYGEAVLAFVIIRLLTPVFSLLIYLILYGFSSYLAIFFEVENLALLVKIGGLVIIFSAFGNIYAALIQKNLNFQKQSLIIVLSVLIDAAVSISITYLGIGIFAIVLGFLSRVVVATGLNIYLGKCYFSLEFRCEWARIKVILQKSIYDMSAQLVNMLCTNMDNFLVGKYFGITNLGYYALAWDLALKPVYAIIPIVTKVKMPIWARLKNEKKLLIADFKKTVIQLLVLLCLIFAVWFFLMPYFIPFWYGEKWIESIGLFYILGWIGLMRGVGSPMNTLALSSGFFKQELYINIFQLCIYLFLLPLCIYFFKEMHIFCWMMVFGYVLTDLVWYIFLRKKFDFR
jgi:O-antigen/teichoic acid export membrane protein